MEQLFDFTKWDRSCYTVVVQLLQSGLQQPLFGQVRPISVKWLRLLRRLNPGVL